MIHKKIVDVYGIEEDLPLDERLEARYFLVAAQQDNGLWHASILGGHGQNAAVPQAAAGRSGDEAIEKIVVAIRQHHDGKGVGVSEA